MTQTIARLKLAPSKAMALKLGHPHLQLQSQLRFTGQIVGGRNITVTTTNGVATIDNSIAFATSAVEYTIDGGGAPIGAGYKGLIEVPFDCQIIASKVFADAPGNLVMDIRKKAYAGLPFVAGDSIVAAAPPTLAGTQFSNDGALVGWLKNISVNDLLGFYVTSATVTTVTISLLVKRL